jgi:hypothetical protein
MRLLSFFEETNNVIADLINTRVDDRSDRDKIEDEADNRVFKNPLPVLSPKDPRWLAWHERGDEIVYDYMEEHGLSYKNGDASKAKSSLSQTQVLPINQLISTERFLDPTALKRHHWDKFSSEYPVIYKVDGNYLITDGNHRIVQAYQTGKSEIEVSVIDVDAFEASMSA